MSHVPMRTLTFAVGIILAFAVMGRSDTLITNNGTKYEGTVTVDHDDYVLVQPNGSRMTFPKAMVARVEKSSSPATSTVKPPTHGPATKSTSDSTGGSTVDISGLTGAGAKPAGDAKLIERVVTGIGTDADKALQAAFSQAIESTVGVLVDAETIVKNNEVIKDQVLTFSRGFIQKYDVLKQWEQDGLRRATIRAWVETGKLTEKLNAHNIATHAIPGELIARQIRFDFKNENEAAEMLRKAMDAFDASRLISVETVGDPQRARDGANAKISITARASLDLKAWQRFSKDVQLILGKAAAQKAALTNRGGWWSDGLSYSWAGAEGEKIKKQLGGRGPWVALFTYASGKTTQWNIFRVPDVMTDVVEEAVKNTICNVVFVLRADDGAEIAKMTSPLVTNPHHNSNVLKMIFHYSVLVDGGWAETWYIGPMWHWGTLGGNRSAPTYDVSTCFVLSTEDMARVAKVTVSIENAPGKK